MRYKIWILTYKRKKTGKVFKGTQVAVKRCILEASTNVRDNLVLLILTLKISQTSCDKLLAEHEENCFKRLRGSTLASVYGELTVGATMLGVSYRFNSLKICPLKNAIKP